MCSVNTVPFQSRISQLDSPYNVKVRNLDYSVGVVLTEPLANHVCVDKQVTAVYVLFTTVAMLANVEWYGNQLYSKSYSM